jgi:hypothetical protein
MGLKDRLSKLPFRKSLSSPTSSSSILTSTSTSSAPPLGPDYKVSPLEIRDLNELIRKRYALDIEIYNRKDCMPINRNIVYDRMTRADVLFAKIMSIVTLWDREEVWGSRADWDRLRDIRQRLENEEAKRTWEGHPPWED